MNIFTSVRLYNTLVQNVLCSVENNFNVGNIHQSPLAVGSLSHKMSKEVYVVKYPTHFLSTPARLPINMGFGKSVSFLSGIK